MTTNHTRLTRRNLLRGAGGGLVGVGIANGLVGASTEPVPVAVGYAGSSGRRAALDAAASVVYDLSFDAVVVEVPPEDAAALGQRSDVRYVERAVQFEAFAQTLPWGVDRVDGEVAHANGETGEGADIAVIDTGISNVHPDLAANLGPGRTFLFRAEAPTQQDDNGHGTHCAGIAAAVGNDRGVVGVSSNATLHGIKAFNATGMALSFDIAAAIDHVVEQGYDVASMSFGASSASELIRDACRTAYDAGVLLVAAAGNSGSCEDCVSYPAAYETVVAVSATTEDDELADFSSQGPEVELAAPGDQIYSTYLGGYLTLSGTSMAAPHVAGAGGLLMADGYSNTEARDRLRQTAEDVGLSENEAGYGLLDAAAAVGLDSSDDLSSDSTVSESSGGGNGGGNGDGGNGGGRSDERGGGSDGGNGGGNGNGGDGGNSDDGSEVHVSVGDDEDGTGVAVSHDQESGDVSTSVSTSSSSSSDGLL